MLLSFLVVAKPPNFSASVVSVVAKLLSFQAAKLL